jgi:hypothetical protein
MYNSIFTLLEISPVSSPRENTLLWQWRRSANWPPKLAIIHYTWPHSKANTSTIQKQCSKLRGDLHASVSIAPTKPGNTCVRVQLAVRWPPLIQFGHFGVGRQRAAGETPPRGCSVFLICGRNGLVCMQMRRSVGQLFPNSPSIDT